MTYQELISKLKDRLAADGAYPIKEQAMLSTQILKDKLELVLPEVDELLELGRSSTDPDVRKDAYYKVQEIVWDEVPCIFLQCPEDLYAYNSSLKNFATNADGRIKFAQLSWN